MDLHKNMNQCVSEWMGVVIGVLGLLLRAPSSSRKKGGVLFGEALLG